MYVCILKKIFENPLKNNKNETEIIRCIYDDLKLAAHVQWVVYKLFWLIL